MMDTTDLQKAVGEVGADDKPPREEITWPPVDLPTSEVRAYAYKIAVPANFEAGGDAVKIAEFWLNVADGDPVLALVRACERMSQIVDTESFGFRRGRSPVMPTGLLSDEQLI